MNKLNSLILVAIFTITANFAGDASAQNFNYGYNQGISYQNGSNWGQQDRIDWNHQRGSVYQNPRAAAVGGILMGIGNALGSNPRNSQAGAILGGIGSGIHSAVPQHHYNQGSISRSQQGFRNNYGGINLHSNGFGHWQNQMNIFQRQPNGYGQANWRRFSP